MYNSGFDDEGMKSEEEFIFKEYTVDDSLSGIDRLKKYRSSDFHLQRLNLVRGLYDTIQELGIEQCYQEEVTDIIQHFLIDSEQSVRKELAEQLYPVAIFYLENGDYDQGYKTLIEIFIPFVFELVIDKKIEVSETATKALVKIARLVHPENVEAELFVTIRNLAHSNQHQHGGEEHRIAAAKLLNELAPIFGQRLCCEQVVPELIHLSRDPSLSVRKAVAQNLSNICPIVGRKITVTQILPYYLDLCQDDIWGVRKACVESLVVISNHVTQKERHNQLTPLFTQFCGDSSRWVKIEMFRQLGKFIATFKKDEDFEKEEEEEQDSYEIEQLKRSKKKSKKVNVREEAILKKKMREAREREKKRRKKKEDDVIPETLIRFFNDMAFQSEQSDTDLVEFCAFNFPAVVKAVGKDKWGLLEKSYKYLVKDMQWKVRKTLAWSLPDIAKILLEEEEDKGKKDAEEMENKKKGEMLASQLHMDFDFDEQSEYFSTIPQVDKSNEELFFSTHDYSKVKKIMKEKEKKRKGGGGGGKSGKPNTIDDYDGMDGDGMGYERLGIGGVGGGKSNDESSNSKDSSSSSLSTTSTASTTTTTTTSTSSSLPRRNSKKLEKKSSTKDSTSSSSTTTTTSQNRKEEKGSMRAPTRGRQSSRSNRGKKGGSFRNKNSESGGDDFRPNELVLIQSAHSFLRDIDDVKLGIVSNITTFMKIITEHRHVEFLNVIFQILKDVENWRIKQKIAEQLSAFMELFNKKDPSRHGGSESRQQQQQHKQQQQQQHKQQLQHSHHRRGGGRGGRGGRPDTTTYPYHFQARKKIIRTYEVLLKDDFAIIRDSTAKVTGKLLNQLIRCGDEENYKGCILYICGLVNGNWINRMLYITVCKYLVREISTDIFESNFLALLLKLASDDSCVNVQIWAAKVLSEHVVQTEQWKNDHRVVKVLNRLKDHEDSDVRDAANQTVVNYNSALQNYDLTQLILEKERKKEERELGIDVGGSSRRSSRSSDGHSGRSGNHSKTSSYGMDGYIDD